MLFLWKSKSRRSLVVLCCDVVGHLTEIHEEVVCRYLEMQQVSEGHCRRCMGTEVSKILLSSFELMVGVDNAQDNRVYACFIIHQP